MALAWLRRSSRAVAALVLLVSMWQLPHRAVDDEICAPGGSEAHDESKHVFTGVSETDHPDHCAVCHWLRSIDPGHGQRSLTAVPLATDTRFFALVSGSLRAPDSSRLPARAPPVL